MKSGFWLPVTLILTLLCGCATSDKANSNTAKDAFEYAKSLEKNGRYEEAIAQYTEVKNKYSYNKLALDAELRVADIQFERKNYIEAQSAYQLFKNFHPTHPKMDYVTFQLAMSYYNQLPKTVGRDLSLASKASLYFDEVIQLFPHSSYVVKAKENKTDCLKKLAAKELYIADFYFTRYMFNSALGRFEGLLKKYPKLELEPQALYGAAVSSYRSKELQKARSYYKKLLSQYPDSNQAQKIKNELSNELQ